MKRLFIVLVLATLLLPDSVLAHVFIKDDTKALGAVLHINPDDDPVAGQKTTFFFDTQKTNIVGVRLVVNDGDSDQVIEQATLSGALASMDYTFPRQGVYELLFEVQTTGHVHIFRYTQRVSRGVSAPNPVSAQRHPLAEVMVLFSGLGLILLGIVVFNRRRYIAAGSKY